MYVGVLVSRSIRSLWRGALVNRKVKDRGVGLLSAGQSSPPTFSHGCLASSVASLLSLYFAHTTTDPHYPLVHTLSPSERTVHRRRNHHSQSLTGPRSPREHHLHLSTRTSPFSMSTAARRRLMRDFKRMQTDPPAGVSASPIADNVMTWYALHRKHHLLLRAATNARP